MNYSIVREFHQKKRVHLFVCKPVERLTREQFNAERYRAGVCGGWYSRKFGKLGGGFAFESETTAQTFANGADSKPAPVADPIPETVSGSLFSN